MKRQTHAVIDRPMKTDINAERIRRLLDYNPETGVFRWRDRPGTKDEKRWKTRYAGKISGSIEPHGYRVITLEKSTYLAHRIAWLHYYGSWPITELDHANLDKDDNRICNLREASRSENCINRPQRGNGMSGCIGVTWHSRDKKWHASITKDRKRQWLGAFLDLEAAISARSIASAKAHGTFSLGCRS